MNVISLKDYAKQNNISYEAVRQQVVRYKDDLAEHIIRDGRQQFLDEEAVAFLDSKRQKNPVAIIQQDKDDTIRNLEEENKNLHIQLENVQAALIAEKDRSHALELENVKIARLEADNEAQRVKVAETEKTAQKLSDELSGLKERNEITETNLKNAQERLGVIQSKWWYRLFAGKK